MKHHSALPISFIVSYAINILIKTSQMSRVGAFSIQHARVIPLIPRLTTLKYKNTDDEDEDNVSYERLEDTVERKRSSRVISTTPMKNLVTVDNLDDFNTYINSNKDTVIVARFFASWCKTCKRTELNFYRYVRKNPNILFINIPFTNKNYEIHEALNVSAVPFGQIYKSTKLVDEMKLTTTNWSTFEKTMMKYKTSV